jgi:colicin import membrane protein
MTQQLMTTTLAKIEQPWVITQYEALENQIQIARQEAGGKTFKYDDPKGNKEARSYIYTLRKLRSSVDTARKEAKHHALEYGRRVDAMAKILEEQVTALIEPHEAEIKALEEKEAQRIAGHREVISKIAALRIPYCWPGRSGENDSAYYRSNLAEVKDIDTSELEEFRAEADSEKLASIAELERLIAAAEKAEAEAEELARLRTEADEREQKERDQRIALEAIEQANREAQAQMEAEAQAAADKVQAAEQAQRDAEQETARLRLEAELAATREAARVEAEKREQERQAEVRRLLEKTSTQRRDVLFNQIRSRIDDLDRSGVTDLIVSENLHPAIKIDWAQVQIDA